MQVYFIRHGKTEWNERGVFQGRTDVGLSEIGRQQARETAALIREAGLSFDLVIASPLIRAVETAVLISGCPEAEIRRDERIAEMAFGIMEGTDFYTPSYPGCEKTKEPFGGLFSDPEHFDAPEGAETFFAVKERTDDFLRYLAELSKRPDGPGSVLVASHGGAIRSMLRTLRGTPLGEIWQIKVPNCRLFHYTFEDGRATEQPDPLGLPPAEAWT